MSCLTNVECMNYVFMHNYPVQFYIAIVSDVSATALNSTLVMVCWTPVNLTVMYHYTVNYTTMGVVNGTVTFPSTVSSGVVSGLQEGQQYQFSVTVTLNISGQLYTGSHNNTQQSMITCEKAKLLYHFVYALCCAICNMSASGFL